MLSHEQVRILEEKLLHPQQQYERRLERKLSFIVANERPPMGEEAQKKYDESVVDRLVSLSRKDRIRGVTFEFFGERIARMARDTLIAKGYTSTVTTRNVNGPRFVLNVSQ